MIESIEPKLSGMTTARLVKIVLAALDTMNETAQINFIAKHIDARASLARLGADDPEAFLEEVEGFCLDCLNEAYYSDDDDVETYFSNNDYDSSYYDDEWDYDEYYSNTEWAETFSRLFRLSVMYIRSGDMATGYEANARLLSCLKEMMSNDCFLGTTEPMAYISANWGELFALHYDALFQYHTDPDQAIEKAFRCWVDFGNLCAEGFLNNVKDVVAAERFILDGLKGSRDWEFQRRYFELLARLYARLERDFDKASLAETLIGCNVYFFFFVVEGLCEQARWQSAAETARTALERIPIPTSDMTDERQRRFQREIRAAVQAKLVDAYEMLMDFEQAFETAKLMFREAPSFALYKRARGPAKNDVDVSALLALVEEQPDRQGFWYGRENLLRDIYSYEGDIQKLLNMALSQEIGKNYYDRKYTALSLIYRAVNGAADIGEDLSEYLTSASGQDGIADMLNRCDDAFRQTELLLHGVALLREIIAFHIGAATRSRYAKAAYYMCVMRDIFVYLKQEDEFRHYFSDVIMQNSRRPALRDEMGVVYGKEATVVKK
jgi:hypothetical protein